MSTFCYCCVSLGVVSLTFASLEASAAEPLPAEAAKRFIAEYEASVRPLQIASAQADWNAQASGKDEDYKAAQEAQNKLDAALADTAAFARLKQIRQDLGKAEPKPDGLLVRQIELLYLEYAGKQLDPELLRRMTAKSSVCMQAFNVYRAKVDGRELPDSEVRKVLRESRDSAYRRAVWEASKGVGAVVEKDLKALVKLRNEAARKLGFADFYEMQLQLGEMTKAEVLKLFDELHELTREPFRESKNRLDARLAADYGIQVAELRPWHYHDPFFQEPPATYTDRLDPIYESADVVKLATQFYAGIGLPIDDVIARSDLYERPGKYPHAMCMDVDREGDIRVMANVVPNHQWMSTMLHELGHAVYDEYLPRSLPYTVRTPSHTFTTEATAMLFERVADQPAWMQSVGLKVPDPRAISEISIRMHRDHVLIFAAWSQVMVRFEAALYADPDQDLNRLWWDLVEKHQLVNRPEGRNAPDYASKIHIISSPVYYHSYIMGEMFASQLHHAIVHDVLKADTPTPLYSGHKSIGDFMKERVFGPGATVRWDGLVRHATGQDLSPKAMMAEITGGGHEPPKAN
ncbi:MAG: M2 family metallopeptidase [Planctomycetes bacterium]|nr:M2 family metallopeptidase [Planctomycetota bacterium]